MVKHNAEGAVLVTLVAPSLVHRRDIAIAIGDVNIPHRHRDIIIDEYRGVLDLDRAPVLQREPGVSREFGIVSDEIGESAVSRRAKGLWRRCESRLEEHRSPAIAIGRVENRFSSLGRSLKAVVVIGRRNADKRGAPRVLRSDHLVP